MGGIVTFNIHQVSCDSVLFKSFIYYITETEIYEKQYWSATFDFIFAILRFCLFINELFGAPAAQWTVLFYKGSCKKVNFYVAQLTKGLATVKYS